MCGFVGYLSLPNNKNQGTSEETIARDGWRNPVSGPRPAEAFETRDAKAQRRPCRDDLPGTDDRAQPAGHRGAADRRDVLSSPGQVLGGGREAGH